MTIKHFLKIAIAFSSTTSEKRREGRKQIIIREEYHRNIKKKSMAGIKDDCHTITSCYQENKNYIFLFVSQVHCSKF